MNKPSDKLVEYIEKLIIQSNHPVSDTIASFLLSEHYLDINEHANVNKMIERSLVNAEHIDFEIPLPLLKLMKTRAQIHILSYDTSKIDFEQLETSSDQIIHGLSRGQYYYELLRLAIDTGHKDLADGFLKTALFNFRKMGSNLMIGRCLEVYGNACFKWKQFDESEQTLNQAVSIYKGLGLPYKEPEKTSSEVISKGYDAMTENKFPPLRELAKVIDMLNTLENPAKLTRRLLKMALDGVDARRGLIIFRRERAPGLSRKASIRVGKREETTISRTLVEQVFKSKDPIFCDNAMTDDYLSSLESVQLSRLRAVACLPVISKGEAVGVLYLDHGGSIRKFTDSDRSYLNLLTNLIGIVLTHSQAIEILKEDVKNLRQSIDRRDGYGELKGRSKTIQDVFSLLLLLREQDLPVLIIGENGTGKELVARIIHRQSSRSARPFIALNCAAFQDTLIESLLFGHIKGAFTGANSDHAGFFEQAEGGTIFLDEVDAMSQSMQSKLLRVLQEAEYYRVGDTKVRKTDVRIITAAKDTLPQSVETGKFREDLFYRLNVVQIKLPPLRERIEDLPLLIDHFIKKISKIHNQRIKGIKKNAELTLQKYHWPGNVRQLENVIRRVFLFIPEDGYVDVEHLPEEILTTNHYIQHKDKSLPDFVNDFERQVVLQTLEQCHWNCAEAARKLKISRKVLLKRIEKYKLKQGITLI